MIFLDNRAMAHSPNVLLVDLEHKQMTVLSKEAFISETATFHGLIHGARTDQC